MAKTVIPLARSPASLAIPVIRSAPSPGPVSDALARPLRDLRISVTDRCNFRCTYCMPRDVFGDDYPFLPQAEVLTFEEIVRLAGIFHGLGIEKVRLTGGEPLMRKGIDRLVAMLREALPMLDLTLTTNGSALKAQARALKSAGLDRITVSLDSLDDATFRRMNDADFPVAKVLEGIDAAAAAGLAPIKVNMVVKRGVNDHQVADMAAHFRGTGHIVRYIEFMDVGSTNGWRMDDVIPSVTEAFCSTCTRARLSTDGHLYTCLFAQRGYDLKALVRSGRNDVAIADAVRAIWHQREDRYSQIRTDETAKARKVEMSFIGG